MDEVLCFEEQRVVSSDWCVSWRTRVFQIDKRHESMALAKRKVTVREKLDGTIQVVSGGGRKLKWKELSARPSRVGPVAREPIVNNRRWVPPAEHPWKRGMEQRVQRTERPASACKSRPATPSRDLHADRAGKVTVLSSR